MINKTKAQLLLFLIGLPLTFVLLVLPFVFQPPKEDLDFTPMTPMTPAEIATEVKREQALKKERRTIEQLESDRQVLIRKAVGSAGGIILSVDNYFAIVKYLRAYKDSVSSTPHASDYTRLLSSLELAVFHTTREEAQQLLDEVEQHDRPRLTPLTREQAFAQEQRLTSITERLQELRKHATPDGLPLWTLWRKLRPDHLVPSFPIERDPAWHARGLIREIEKILATAEQLESGFREVELKKQSFERTTHWAAFERVAREVHFLDSDREAIAEMRTRLETLALGPDQHPTELEPHFKPIRDKVTTLRRTLNSAYRDLVTLHSAANDSPLDLP